MKKFNKIYWGFKIMNSTTKETSRFEYPIGTCNVYAENQAIQKLMEMTGLTRGQFYVCELIKR